MKDYKVTYGKTFGLGDAVAIVANPIAQALDKTLGTKIVGCGGCARRQAALNAAVPNINPLARKAEENPSTSNQDANATHESDGEKSPPSPTGT